MTTPAHSLLTCTGVTKAFATRRGAVPVLQGIDLAVTTGEVLVIRGRSGAGKSTLLHLLGGLDLPTAGEIALDGTPYAGLSTAARAALRRARIGIIFQSFNLIPTWTARENVEAALLHTPTPPAERRARAEALLASLGLSDRADHLPGELSAGQQQRVAVARALLNDPPLLLADEPTGDVDPDTGAEIVDLLLAHARGRTLVVATHGAFPLDRATRVLTLRDGVLADM
jgi:putative ABC transport system ATP-binding protein